jgi:hypothetical protein
LILKIEFVVTKYYSGDLLKMSSSPFILISDAVKKHGVLSKNVAEILSTHLKEAKSIDTMLDIAGHLCFVSDNKDCGDVKKAKKFLQLFEEKCVYAKLSEAFVEAIREIEYVDGDSVRLVIGLTEKLNIRRFGM